MAKVLNELDLVFMKTALEMAKLAASLGEVPVGAVVVYENQVIARAYNQKESLPSALAHAEILAIQESSRVLNRWRLTGCTLYVTLEPCIMCAGALVQARVDKVVFGALDPKAGAAESIYKVLSDPRLNHRPEIVSGVLETECGLILSEFFRKKRS